MKGIGRTVMRCDTEGHRIELVRFTDASLSIRRDGETLGVWEPVEEDECFAVLAQLVGLGEDSRTPVLIVSTRGLWQWAGRVYPDGVYEAGRN